jgi:hypothetical protein
MFLGSRARPVGRADVLPPSVSRLSRQCGIPNISQLYRPPRPVTGIAFYVSKEPVAHICILGEWAGIILYSGWEKTSFCKTFVISY